jgi:hypothetical protein
MPRDYNPPPVALSPTGGVGMIPVYQSRRNGEQELIGYQEDPNYAPPIIDVPKPASILALEKQLGNTFEPVYKTKSIQEKGHNGGQVTVNYGEPIGYRIDPGNSTYVNFDAQGNYSNTTKRGGALSGFEPFIGVALNFIVPGLGEAITASLVNAGVVSAGAFANALGSAIANATVSVAQGVPLETALRNAVVNTVVNTGSQQVASAVNEIIGNADITNAIVSTAGSAVKTSLMGGSADDIARAATAGLVSSAAQSAYIGAVDGASQSTANLIGATVGGAVTGGEMGAITAALNQLSSQVGKKTLAGVYKTAADIEYDRLKALDEADAAVEAAFATVKPIAGSKTAEDIEYEKQKALDDADAAVNNMFASVTVQATQDVTQSILNLIGVTPTPVPSPGTVLQQVTVAATPTVSVSPNILSTVDVQATQNVTQQLIDQILNTVTVTGATVTVTPTTLQTVTVKASPMVSPTVLQTVTVVASPTVTPTVLDTVTVRATQTVLPTVTISATAIVTPTVLDTVTVRATQTVLPTVTIRATSTVLPTVTITGTVTVLPTVDIVSTPTVKASPTIITEEPSPSPTVKYSPTIRIVTTVTPPKPTVTPPSKVLAQALSIAPYRGAGEIEDPSTGKKRRNVWNEESLRLKDALGI